MSVNISLPTPPDDERTDLRVWRYQLRQTLEDVLDALDARIDSIEALPSSRTWPGFAGAPYPLRVPSRTSWGSVAWCLESDTPCLLWVSNASDRVIVTERVFDRWRTVTTSAAALAGQTEVTVTNPYDIIYVPLVEAETHGGKFWVSSSTSDTIVTIDPHNSYATSSFALGASESNITCMVYDADHAKVWMVTGGGTRVIRVHPGTGANEAQSTGWTAVTKVAPTSSKIWLSKTSGVATARLQYLDASTLGATNPGINCAAGGCDGIYNLGDSGYLLAMRGGGNVQTYIVDNAAATGTQFDLHHSLDAGFAVAYIDEMRNVVVGGRTYAQAFDLYSTQMTSYGMLTTLGSSLVGSMSSTYYIPEYKEVIGNADGVGCPWVFPSVLELSE